MGRHVVDAVVAARQDDVQVLEGGDPPRQAEVRVGPFMYLRKHTHAHINNISTILTIFLYIKFTFSETYTFYKLQS